MPVVTVAAPRHPAMPALLTLIADAAADALGLVDGDVLATHAPVEGLAASGTGIVDDGWWPVITLHGGDRGADASAAAARAVESAVHDWGRSHGRTLAGVWVAWSHPR
jgi:hypothetical protein